MARLHFDIGDGKSLCGHAPESSIRCSVCLGRFHYGPEVKAWQGAGKNGRNRADHEFVREDVPPPPYLTTILNESNCPSCRAVIWNNSPDSLAQPGRRWGIKEPRRTDIPFRAVVVPIRTCPKTSIHPAHEALTHTGPEELELLYTWNWCPGVDGYGLAQSIFAQENEEDD